MAGYERAQQAVIGMAQEVLRPYMEDKSHTQQVGEALRNTLLDLPGPREAVGGSSLSPLDTFRARLIRDFGEISSSYEALQDIALYISRFPYRDTRITRPGHLRYHFEQHLNEIYILRGRVVDCCKRISRAYRSDRAQRHVQSHMDAAIHTVESTLTNIVGVRGAHVHVRRFTAPDIERLELLEMFERHPIVDDEEGRRIFQAYGRLEYRTIRKKWRKNVKDNTEAMKTLLDLIGDHVVAAIFTGPDEALVPPLALTGVQRAL